MDVRDAFSPSYVEARARFRAALDRHPHAGPRGTLPVLDDFTVDWAWTGDPNARDILTYTSGVHGIEGYAGSAVQLELLARGSPTPTLWIHAVNPWGMAHFRRVNENNVDLNRNFLAPGQPYAAEDGDYARLDAMLNPKGRPGRVRFLARAVTNIAIHGMGPLTNAVARGQYSFPQGIFYGGNRLQDGPRVLLEFLDTVVPSRRKVMHMDLHVARGAWGQYVAFLEGLQDDALQQRAQRVWGDKVRTWAAGTKDAYDMRGGMLAELRRRYPGVRYDAITLEFGTQGNLDIVRALRAENQLFFHAAPDNNPHHPARLAMRAAFYPLDVRWQRGVLRYAPLIHAQALGMLNT